MIKKFKFGTPFETDAVVKSIPLESSSLPYFETDTTEGLKFTLPLSKEDAVYGLGESVRGINKRGYIYRSFCSDDPNQTEGTHSLYGAHNFIVISTKDKTFGVFFDCPSTVTFDIAFTYYDKLVISSDNTNMYVYIIDGDSIYDIIREFRIAIGMSYIPPMWAFGYTQSRWSYADRDSVRNVVKGYRDLDIPLDAVYLDIDYMERYKDFTVDEKAFGDLKVFADEMKAENIRLVPIIDAGVKIEEGYDVYEEGIKNNYFCTDKDGKPFEACVWPGMTHFPDFLNPEARLWFGEKYKILTDMGIEGFWNDMNEPAIFYSQKSVDNALKLIKEYAKEDTLTLQGFEDIKNYFGSRQNCDEDYSSIYHNTPQGKYCHKDVHNLFGYNMTRSAAAGLLKADPDKRFLLFSRASYIGMHRYSGIWTGDNFSWWSHILTELKVLPGLNMCGFLYVGADLGGFGYDCSRDLLLRWLSLGIFTPLMRNHAACATRNQECYQFEKPEDFKHIIDLRYRLIPYLYSEYMKAAKNGEMMFKPLAFEYPDDLVAKCTEDQLIVGNEIMIAPVYTQNALGRYVYLPEDMTAVRMQGGELTFTDMKKGHHFVEIPENEVVFFIRSDKAIPLCNPAKCVEELDLNTLELIGNGKEYVLYTDDGFAKDYDNPENLKTLKKQ
ncbi:MAG: alpha-glucosidase [Ruminococcaceae bacterium]|nr:alpha-glucosidase [Oscillospiraceae bacterium]